MNHFRLSALSRPVQARRDPARWIAAVSIFALAASCGLSAPQSSRRTLMGLDQQEALVAAHRLLSDRAFEIESVDASDGSLATEWRDQGLRSIRYEITARPAPSDEGEAVQLEILALARDRAVSGWSEGYAVAQPADRLIRDIARAADREARNPIVVDTSHRESPVEATPPEPQCSSSDQCPPGQHCGSGRCVWECATDRDCGDGLSCDRRGRCLVPPPPPPTLSPSDGAPVAEEE